MPAADASPPSRPPQPRAASRRLVRLLFAGVILFVVVQFGLAYGAEEPVPSFVFPSFEGAPDAHGPVRLLRAHLVVTFADRAVVVPYARLLEPAPRVVADAIVYSVFGAPSRDPHP